VVEKESAARYFAPARQLPGTDHFSSVKPDNPDHPAHVFLCTFLRDLERQEELWGVANDQRVTTPTLAPLRHFLYLSSAKLDALYEQVAQGQSASSSMFDKFEKVRHELMRRNQVGVPSGRESYFIGHIDAVLSHLDFYHNSRELPPSGPMVMFTSFLEDGRTLILVGSLAFMVGSQVTHRATVLYSHPKFWAGIAEDARAAFDVQIPTKSPADSEMMSPGDTR